MTSLKFLIVTTDFEGMDDGRVGHSIRMSYLANWLRSEGHVVSLLITKLVTKEQQQKCGFELLNNDPKILNEENLNIPNLCYHMMEHDIRYLVTSSPPLINNQIGLQIKKFAGDAIMWACDVRDHASLHPYLRPKDEEKLIKLKKLEATIAYSADLNTVVSDYSLDYQKALGIALDLPLRPEQITTIFNGAVPVEYEEVPQKILEVIQKAKSRGRKIFGFFGSGNISKAGGNKSLLPILSAIASAPELGVTLIICGAIQQDPELLDQFKTTIDLHIFQPVNYAQSRSAIRLCDAGITMNIDREHAPTIIGGKVYDYLVEGKKILAAFPDNAYSIQTLACRHPDLFYLCSIHSTNDIAKACQKLVSDLETQPVDRGQDTPSLYFRTSQMSNLLSAILNQDKDITSKTYDSVYLNSAEYQKPWKGSIYAKSWEAVATKLNQLMVTEGPQIIDIGCGPGQFAECLYELSPTLSSYRGFDFSIQAIESAKGKLLDSRFSFHNEDALSVDLTDGLVVCLEAMEHMRDDISFLQRIPIGTTLVLSVPNFPSKTHYRFFRDMESVITRYRPYLNIKDYFTTEHNETARQKLFYLVGQRV